ncbi:MAG: hypothetical protein JEY94_14280 [Melioribacteraceae bacterium]|nr:hypothetical protein [Melioribacteraceae bacterium]
MNMAYKKYIYLVLVPLAIFLKGCSYSFTGASVPPHLNSIAIIDFKDKSGSGEPELRDKFTSELIQNFLDDNTLFVTEKENADALLECTVTSIKDAPDIVSQNDQDGGESISSRRLTITVKVMYRDMVKRKTIFDKQFSDYSNYQTDEDPFAARQTAIDDTITKICEDILLGVVSNW